MQHEMMIVPPGQSLKRLAILRGMRFPGFQVSGCKRRNTPLPVSRGHKIRRNTALLLLQRETQARSAG